MAAGIAKLTPKKSHLRTIAWFIRSPVLRIARFLQMQAGPMARRFLKAGKESEAPVYEAKKAPEGRMARLRKARRFLNAGKKARERRTARLRMARVDGLASVYLAGVLEYLAAEVLDLAGTAAKDQKKNRIGPQQIRMAVWNDNELSRLIESLGIDNHFYI